MKFIRFVLTLGALSMSALSIVAQVDTPTTPTRVEAFNSTVMGLALVGVLLIVAFVIIAREQAWKLSAERDDELFIRRKDGTEQYIDKGYQTNGTTKRPLDSSPTRANITRTDGDTRPYLVLTLRQSKSKSLTIGKRWIIKPDDTPFTIGTHNTSDIHIEDVYVSRQHLTINYDDNNDTYVLIDNRSANGTRWDGISMIKRRPYAMPARHDVQIEITNAHIFNAYIDAFIPPIAEQVAHGLPDQQLLPDMTEAHLTWVSPETEIEQTMQLTHVITTIGRGDKADAHINHPLISETHAYIVWRDSQFLLVDQSANGTWLSGIGEAFRLEPGKFTRLEADINCRIEIVRDVVQLNFRYTQNTLLESNLSPSITDELPSLPAGVLPLLHVVRDGANEQRREIRVTTGEITIGTGEENFVRFTHDVMAEEHAKIVFDDGLFWLYDLSGMGTMANQRRLHGSRMKLEPQEIYHIRIHDQQPNEVMLAFYYELKGDADEWHDTTPENQRLTQKIDVRPDGMAGY
ncbi:MAG: FHA domain-containing protein [Anaerolineae bacterium]